MSADRIASRSLEQMLHSSTVENTGNKTFLLSGRRSTFGGNMLYISNVKPPLAHQWPPPHTPRFDLKWNKQ